MQLMANRESQDIMILLKKKQNHIDQIYKYTMDMEKSASQNDTDTINMLLELRYKLMMEVEEFDERIERVIQSLSPIERIKISAQMSENPISSEVSFEESKINEIWLSTRILLGKIIESDEKLKLKIEALSKLSSMDSV